MKIKIQVIVLLAILLGIPMMKVVSIDQTVDNNTPIVDQHFKNGTDIKAATSAIDDDASCIMCHSLSEMKVVHMGNDSDIPDAALVSHYGKSRKDLRTNDGGTNCTYCHQNESTVFSIAMLNIDNEKIINHSTSPLNPNCTACHGTGKIHDYNLSKPVSNDSLCKNCHSIKSEHKTLLCTQCHANNSDKSKAGRDIHGIKYLQKDNTFIIGNIGKTNAVDCTTCHQLSIVDGTIGMNPPKIGDSIRHSNDITNGSKWGNYWISAEKACLYCHNNTIHNSTPLGRLLEWNPSYILNTSIGSGTNCANCHYKGASNYSKMASVFTNAGLEIPPEITSGNWNGRPGYLNHLFRDYTDQACKSCHYQGTGTTVGQMVHDISKGAGGDNCTGCHSGAE